MSANEAENQGVIGLPGDERDVLIGRVIDGGATQEDWASFRAVAAHDPSIWGELAQTQELHESISSSVCDALSCADRVELPGGLMDDQPLHNRLETISRWGGWAAAAAILLVWFVGKPMMKHTGGTLIEQANVLPSFGSNPLLDESKPDQAFGQYLSAGRQSGQVVGEMPDRIVIETRPMEDGTIEVLYLRQIIERQIIDHAYHELHDEMGNVIPVPIKLAPMTHQSY